MKFIDEDLCEYFLLDWLCYSSGLELQSHFSFKEGLQKLVEDIEMIEIDMWIICFSNVYYFLG